MTRIALIFCFVLSILVSFSVQAGSRHGHHDQHYSGHHNQQHGGHHQTHQRHHNKHHGHHYTQTVYGHRYRHDHHYSYYGWPKFNTVPHVTQGTLYGYSASGRVIVYPTYPYRYDHQGYGH